MELGEDSLSHQSRPPDHSLPAMINPDPNSAPLSCLEKGAGVASNLSWPLP